MKVFLSSTALDLVEHRKVVDDSILRLSQTSVLMERFGPVSGEPVEVCELKARESDVVVCIAAHPDCQYAWGEADPAQVWGEAYISNHEMELARRAFERALAVRRRIEHPGAAETEEWLSKVA